MVEPLPKKRKTTAIERKSRSVSRKTVPAERKKAVAVRKCNAPPKKKNTPVTKNKPATRENTPLSEAQILEKRKIFLEKQKKFFDSFDYKQKPKPPKSPSKQPKITKVTVRKFPTPDDSQPILPNIFKPDPRKPQPVRNSHRNPSPSISPIREESLEPRRKSKRLREKKNIDYTKAFEISPAISTISEQNEVEFCVAESPEFQDSQLKKKKKRLNMQRI